MLPRLTRSFLLVALCMATQGYAQSPNEQLYGRYQDWMVYRDNTETEKRCYMRVRRDKSPTQPTSRLDLSPSGRPGFVLIYGRFSQPNALPVPDPKTDKLRVTWLPATQAHPLPIRGTRAPVPERPVMMMHSFLVPSEPMSRFLAEARASRSVRIELPNHSTVEFNTAGFAEAYAALKTCQPDAKLP